MSSSLATTSTDFGLDVSITQRTNRLEMPDGSFQDFVGFDYAPDMRTASGRAGLAEGIARRLTTYRGTLIDVEIPTTIGNYGTDITQWINEDFTARQIGMLSAAVDAECAKDERIVRSTTAATFTGGVLILAINIVDGAGPFALTLAVSNVTTQILAGPT